MKIPATMKAVVQKSVGGQLEIIEIETPKPTKGQVLVRMTFSPLNPSDIGVLKGHGATKPSYPLVPGIEGSGIVVASGGGLLANLRNGKRVALTSTANMGGTWAEYVVTSAMHCIPLTANTSLESGSTLIVNPMTAIAFLRIARHKKTKAVVITAAASNLGSMLNRLFIANGIKVINIVHRQKLVDDLKLEGYEYVLDSSSPEFEKTYKELVFRLKANLILDAVTGELSEKLIANAPNKTTLLVYGNLAESKMKIDSRTILQGDKDVVGFFLGNYTSKNNIFQTLNMISQAKKLINSTLESNIKEIIPFTDVNTGLENYLKSMTGGKILLKF